jgi:hypothetical protein
MIAHHVVGKGSHGRGFGFLQGELGIFDVDDARRVGDVGDLRIRQLGVLRARGR